MSSLAHKSQSTALKSIFTSNTTFHYMGCKTQPVANSNSNDHWSSSWIGYVHIFLEEEMILPIQETANGISAPSTYIRIGINIPTIQIGEESNKMLIPADGRKSSP